jgi:electron transport complex protein RnfC
MMRFIKFKRSFELIKFDAPPIHLAGNAFLPSTAIVPLLQHYGTPSVPVVVQGDRVKEGQLIARGTGMNSAHIHAPIPGIVREFRILPLPDAKKGLAAIIQLAGSFDILGRKEENFSWRFMAESEILRVLEEKGVVNTFEHAVPLAASMRSARNSGSPVLALRLFDSDPTCQLDSFLARNQLQTVLEGAAVLAKGLDAEKIYLLHDDNKWTGPDDSGLEEIFQKRKVSLLKVGKRYPSGNTRQVCALIREKKTVLIDPVTAISAFDAVIRNQPVIHRFVAVTGPALDSPAILKVRIGTPIGDIIEECGGFRTDPTRIVINGLLAGNAVYDLDTPVTKYTKSIHIMDNDTCPSYTVRDCIHCGRCLQVCPVSIDPMRLASAIRKEKLTGEQIKSCTLCQFCGCCAIVCPSRIPLHQIIRESCERRKGDIK